MEKSNQNIRTLYAIKKLPQRSNRQIGKNSSNLVTLADAKKENAFKRLLNS
jgi:hypothetical protein